MPTAARAAAAVIRRAAATALAASLLLSSPAAIEPVDARGWVQIQPAGAAMAAVVSAGSGAAGAGAVAPLDRVLRELAAVPGSSGGGGGEPTSWEVIWKEKRVGKGFPFLGRCAHVHPPPCDTGDRAGGQREGVPRPGRVRRQEGGGGGSGG